MKRTLKFLHSLGGIGLLGAMATLLVCVGLFSEGGAESPTDPVLLVAMDRIARWILLPSLGLTLVAGLLSMAVVPGFHNAGWAWLKLATGVLMFEGSLLAIQGPIQAAADAQPPLMDQATQHAIYGSLWLLGGVAVVNVLLGIWRPKSWRWWRGPAG